MPISFKTTSVDRDLIESIAIRAVALAKRYGSKIRQRDTEMDLLAVHVNIYPLDLDGLLKADDFNLAHDVFGIGCNLNRRTCALQNCFLPRFARPRLIKGQPRNSKTRAAARFARANRAGVAMAT